MGDRIFLNLDESGNLGRKGKYFTIACIETDNNKPLTNVMKRAVLAVKKKYSRFEGAREIKCSDANPIIKDYILRRISSKDNVKIRYIVADKEHVKSELLEDENLLYNFMLQLLIVPIARRQNVDELVINLDKRSIKVKSENSFEDYIRIKLNYEYNLNVKVTVRYLESHNSYPIQAADFIANVVNTRYEYGDTYNYDLIKDKIVKAELFPKRSFGQQKVVNL